MSGFIVSSNATFAPKEPVPAGSQIAICTQLVVLGTVTDFNKFENKTETKVKVHIGFELCDVQHEYDGKVENRVITKRFNNTLHENSALRPFLVNWRGQAFTAEQLKGFDIRDIVGKPCMLTIAHKKKENGEMGSNISGISPLHKSMPKPVQTLPTLMLAYGEGHWNWDTFEALPNYLKEIMRDTPEFKALGAAPVGSAAAVGEAQAKAATPVVDDADLPF